MIIPVRSNAHLQRIILTALQEEATPSVTALARRVGSSRPSVSRSLHALEAAGLVTHDRRSWSITPVGLREATRISSRATDRALSAFTQNASLQRQMGSLSALFSRSLAPASVSMLNPFDLAPSAHLKLAPDVAAAMRGIAAMNVKLAPDVAAAMRGIAAMNVKLAPDVAAAMRGIAAMNVKLAPDVVDAIDALNAVKISPAMDDAYKSMAMQFSAISGVRSWWTAALADNLATTSRIAADLAAIADVVASPNHGALRFATGLDSAVTQVVRVHRHQLAAALEQLQRPTAGSHATQLVIRPTATTAAFTGVARDGALPPQRRLEKTDLVREAVEDLALELEELGAAAAARDLRSSFDVLHRRHPGWAKSTPHLLREVLREVLDELAPRDHVPGDSDGRVTKRAQMLWIVGDNDTLVTWMDVTATNVGKLHSLLSAEAKNTGDPRVGVAGMLGLLEVAMGLLRTLVEQAVRRRQS